MAGSIAGPTTSRVLNSVGNLKGAPSYGYAGNLLTTRYLRAPFSPVCALHDVAVAVAMPLAVRRNWTALLFIHTHSLADGIERYKPPPYQWYRPAWAAGFGGGLLVVPLFVLGCYAAGVRVRLFRVRIVSVSSFVHLVLLCFCRVSLVCLAQVPDLTNQTARIVKKAIRQAVYDSPDVCQRL